MPPAQQIMFAVFGVIAPSTADHVCRFWGHCPKHGRSCLTILGSLPQAQRIMFAVFGVIAPGTADHVCRWWGHCPKRTRSFEASRKMPKPWRQARNSFRTSWRHRHSRKTRCCSCRSTGSASESPIRNAFVCEGMLLCRPGAHLIIVMAGPHDLVPRVRFQFRV